MSLLNRFQDRRRSRQFIAAVRAAVIERLDARTLLSGDWCPRTITFALPGNPALQVTGVENEGAGSIDFTADVLDGPGLTADLRALYFHFTHSKLATLAVTDTDGLITGKQFAADGVINLGEGANLNGVAGSLDVGVKFGVTGIGSKKDDLNYPVHFTLSDAAHDLTLDDFAHLQFGARLDSIGGPGGTRTGVSKLVGVAPAAPRGVDDSFTIFEDGAAGLNSPSKSPSGVVLDVLANDTDADGDALSVTAFHNGPSHGSVAVNASGQPVYTPNLDYSGTDSFEYCVSDGHGGQDHATAFITVTAVADVPTLTYSIDEGATVNQTLINVTATQDDADSSEFVDGIATSVVGGSLPAGVTIVPAGANPATEPDQIVQQFVVTVPMNTDTTFGLNLSANSQEVSNADQETRTATVPIVFEFKTVTIPVMFTATDQSIWNSGPQFTILDDRFVGLDTGPFDESLGSALYAGIAGHIKLGFQSTLTFEGGKVDATACYDVTINTNYNKTTDQLQIDSSSSLTAASISTRGPEGSYKLDLLWDVALDAYAGVNVDFGEIDLDPTGLLPGDWTVDLGGIHERKDLGMSIGPGSFNLLNLTSQSIGGSIGLPAPVDAFSINYAWPHITTDGSYPPNPVTSQGESNNFLELQLDVDQLVTEVVGIPNVLDPPRVDAGPFYFDMELLGLEVFGGLNFLQNFGLSLGGLNGALTFEDGSSPTYNIGDTLVINHASETDAAGNDDGLVDFAFAGTPAATLRNQTDVGFNIGYRVRVFSVELGYDIEIPNPFSDVVGPDHWDFSDSISLPPLTRFGDSAPLGSINVFDQTFSLDFAQGGVSAST